MARRYEDFSDLPLWDEDDDPQWSTGSTADERWDQYTSSWEPQEMPRTRAERSGQLRRPRADEHDDQAWDPDRSGPSRRPVAAGGGGNGRSGGGRPLGLASDPRRWKAAGALGVVVAVVAGTAVAMSGASGSSALPTTTTTTTAPVVVTTTRPATTTRATRPASQLKRSLRKGMSGDAVKQLQLRLFQLGFMPGGDGKATGTFGPLTQQAVWAFESLFTKTAPTKLTGVVTNAMWQTMQGDIRILPRRPKASAVHLEIYLEKQVAIIFKNNKPWFISHISSGKVNADGSPYEFHEQEKITEDLAGNPVDPPVSRWVIGLAYTPIGKFKVERKKHGKRTSPLGGMLNPVYFNQGIAIHGGYNVPLTRESHGCIRVPNAISEYLVVMLNVGDDVFVFDGKKEPEDATKMERAMRWNRVDPSKTTTTTRPKPTSTTKKPTATTKKPTATTKKPTATTKKPTATTKKKPTATTKKPTATTKKRTTTTVKKTTTTKP